MVWLTSAEQKAAEALGAIGYSNPFLPERVEHERQALGPEFISYDLVINRPVESNPLQVFPNVLPMRARAEALANKMRNHLVAGGSVDEADLLLYEKVVLYLLFSRYNASLDEAAYRHLKFKQFTEPVPEWNAFLRDHRDYLNLQGRSFPLQYEPAHIFATFFQIQRAFYFIFQEILGRSMSIARMRAAIWQSIFTHDMHRYARTLYQKMDKVPTLIQGPSGSGKELVAQAIGLSRYIPFHPTTASFETDRCEDFIAVNLSALAPSLIESELFGHSKGAFSGATKNHAGYLGRSKARTCVFLDEIGEVDLSIQVKLLRALQMRTYQRVGETKLREFQGKLIAATNRNLLAEIRAGRFREDFYFRLCADLIHTPSLGEQLAECPEDLPMLVRLLVPEILNEDADEADRLTQEVVAWVHQHLGQDYGWPGNFRELGQCIRNVMIRGSYVPSRWSAHQTPDTPRQKLGEAVKSGAWTLEEVLQHYTSLVYADSKSYTAAGERLAVDWRTVKDKISEDLVAQYQTSR